MGRACDARPGTSERHARRTRARRQDSRFELDPNLERVVLKPSRLGCRFSWGNSRQQATSCARIWDAETLRARRLHSRRVRPARSLYRTHQRAQPSCKLIRAPGGQPAGRRAPTSWPNAARRRAAAAGAVSAGRPSSITAAFPPAMYPNGINLLVLHLLGTHCWLQVLHASTRNGINVAAWKLVQPASGADCSAAPG